MGRGSLRPNCSRMRAWISGGTLALVAASPSGSPGARARMVKSTRLIPASTGTANSSRRSRYLDMRGWRRGRADARPLAESGLSLLVPEGQVPEVRVPPALHSIAQLVADGGDARPPGHRDHHDVLDQQVVHLDEQPRALYRIELGLSGIVDDLLVLLAPRIDWRLVGHLEPLALLGADAVGPAFPAGRVQDLVGLVDAELPLGVLGAEALRGVEEIGGHDGRAPVDLLLHGGAVHEQVERLAHRGVGEKGVLGL